jgi:hypothetical protein
VATVVLKDKGDELMPTPGENHDKGPGLAQHASVGVEQATGRAEVDLGLFPRQPFDTHGGVGRARLQGTHKAVNRGVAASVALFFEALPERPDLHALGAKLNDQLAIGFDG